MALQVAKKLGVSHFTVVRWLREGLLVGDQVTPRALRRILLGPSVRRFGAGPAPKGWLPPKETANALGVSRGTVLHWAQTGRLEAMVAGKGRRAGLRINVAANT